MQVSTAHFRPNFVVNGVRAHEEDGWQSIRIGGSLRFRVTGPCSRYSTCSTSRQKRRRPSCRLPSERTTGRESNNIILTIPGIGKNS
ncbi:unnamed protein product, partial [Hapterophycus canaliculatus]